MIPIISISNFVNTVVTATIAIRLLARVRRNHHEGTVYLAAFFTALTGFWAFRAIPGLLIKDPFAVMATNLVSYVFLFIATTNLLQVPFIFINRRQLGVILGILNVVIGLVFLLGRFFNPIPHTPIVIAPYIFWKETYSPLLRALAGLSSFSSTTIFMGIFFVLGHRERNNIAVYRRSMYLAGGMVFLVIASFIFFLVSAGGFITSVLASGSCMIGSYLMFLGISHENGDSPRTQESSLSK